MIVDRFMDILIAEKGYSPHTCRAYRSDIMDFLAFFANTPEAGSGGGKQTGSGGGKQTGSDNGKEKGLVAGLDSRNIDVLSLNCKNIFQQGYQRWTNRRSSGIWPFRSGPENKKRRCPDGCLR
jgi:hypothetical protein